jgi:23S rRNA (uracil1939-C5)-methyltransferase
MELVIDAVLAYAQLTGSETVLELYSGIGLLLASLAAAAGQVVAIEQNPDAVADAVHNLDHTDNVSLYQGMVEEVLPELDIAADLMVIHPDEAGMSRQAVTAVVQHKVRRLITVSADIATMARDGKQLHQAGYRLVDVQPIDMQPQTFHVETVMLWERP